MSNNKNSIGDLISNVNTINEEALNYFAENILECYEESESHQDFIVMIRKDKQPKSKKILFNSKLLNQLVPHLHKNYLKSIIKNQFKGDEVAYMQTVPLFFECFTRKDKLICDEAIATDCKKERRKFKRQRKQLIIYSAQLLKLMGLKRSAIITNDCVNFYREEMQKTDDFLAQYRLVAGDGTITKLTNNEDKQRQKIAQILKISEYMSLKAKDKGFSFMLLTLTLPPAFHCNAYSGKDSFQGYTPAEALATINRYWKAIRAKLHNEGFKVGEDFFGIQVLELQGGSTLHLHCLMYSREEDQGGIQAAIERVRVLENSKYHDKNTDSAEQKKFNLAHRIGAKIDGYKADNWDVSIKDDTKVTDETNAGARYVFKYIMKTHTSYTDKKEDDSALKNLAARFFYSCRGFNFFGMKGGITKFNFLQKNFSKYEDILHRDLCRVLASGDYYDFLEHYEHYFKNVYTDDKDKRFIGVIFDKSLYEEENNLTEKSILNNEVVMICKKQYCVFEKMYDPEITKIEEADFSKLEYANLKHSYDNAQLKQAQHDFDMKQYLEESKLSLATSKKLNKAEAIKLYNFGNTEYLHDYDSLGIDVSSFSHVGVVQLLNAIQGKTYPADNLPIEDDLYMYDDSCCECLIE